MAAERDARARAILDLLGKPVEVEDDEFLDNLQKKASFYDMPDKPSENYASTITPLMNEQQQAMLDGLADSTVDDFDEEVPAVLTFHSEPKGPAPAAAQEVDPKTRRFFNLFQGVSKETNLPTSVPDNLQFEDIKGQVQAVRLPMVGDTEEEKEAKREDLERRSAYLEYQAKQEHLEEKRKKSDLYEKSHQAFIAQFDNIIEKK